MPTSQFDIGLMLGEALSEVRSARAMLTENRHQSDRMEQQQHQILSSNQQLTGSMTHLAQELVDLRERVGKIELVASQAVQIPMRPRLPSMNDEDKRMQSESIRVQAVELPKQTEALTEQTRLMAEAEKKREQERLDAAAKEDAKNNARLEVEKKRTRVLGAGVVLLAIQQAIVHAPEILKFVGL